MLLRNGEILKKYQLGHTEDSACELNCFSLTFLNYGESRQSNPLYFMWIDCVHICEWEPTSKPAHHADRNGAQVLQVGASLCVTDQFFPTEQSRGAGTTRSPCLILLYS